MINNEQPKTYIAFDFGLKHIGVAVGQSLTKTAKPLTAIKAEEGEPQWEIITKIIKEWQPNALIVGFPLNMDGTKQFITEKTEGFILSLKERFNLPVYAMDERLSTKEAKQQLFDQGGYRALKKSAIDAASAQIILESFLQSNQSIPILLEDSDF